MTVHEAIQEVRKVGTIREENGKLKLRFPEPERARLEPAIEALQRDRKAAFQALGNIPPAEVVTIVTPEPDPARLTVAGAALAWGGVRLMALESDMVVGVWSDLDCAELRAAIAAFGPDQTIAYLDGPGIPMKYKLRRVAGEPVPMSVLVAMEQNPTEPWKVRDEILDEIGWRVNGIPWPQWQTATRQRLLQKQREARWLCV